MNAHFPINFSKVDIYYIYPFVLDFQSIPSPDGESVLRNWIEKETGYAHLNNKYPLKWGLHQKRRGYPPILPYQELVYKFGNYGEFNLSDVELAPYNSPQNRQSITELLKEKIFTVRECGNGSLTYKLTASDQTSLTQIIQLIPRRGDNSQSREKKSLFDDVRRELSRVEKLLKKASGVEKKKVLWEDSRIIFVKDVRDEHDRRERHRRREADLERAFTLPFTFIVLYLKPNWYGAFRRFYSRVVEGSLSEIKPIDRFWIRSLLALMYQYRGIIENQGYKYISPDLERFKRLRVNLAFFDYMTCFCNHTSFLAVVSDETPNEDHQVAATSRADFLHRYSIPTAINAIEMEVTRFHFAVLLDSLLDNLLLKMSKKNNSGDSSDMEGLRNEFYALQLQAALFLEDVSQYICTGYIGNDVTNAFRKAFQTQELERRIRWKMEMTERVLLAKQLEIDDAICKLTQPHK